MWTYKTFDELTKDELYLFLKERSAIFVFEQQSPYHDIDGRDPDSIHISYIELFPLIIDKKCGYSELNSAKEIKIFNSEKIIFEGTLYLKNPSVVLFCSENKITKNININYLIKYVKNRNYKEEKKDDIFTLILD